MSPLLLLAATATAPITREASIVRPHTLSVTHTVVTTTSVDVPDLIAPAVIPYFRCIAARNRIVFSEKGAPLPPPVAAGADCRAARKVAIDQADALMKAASGGADTPEARYARIAATLQSIESLVVPQGAPGN